MSGSGYKCEFLDEVPERFHCKKCSLVARKATLTTCCTETYCQACIVDLQETHKVCLLCGEEGFTTIKAVKYEKAIEALQVYCSMKERGCGWTGTLGQLDTHLDPDQDKCQYVDTKCPLKCQQVVPKNKVEEHVAQHCSKRPHVCQHCGFKGSYEEVVESHLQECKYVPLQCPNLCGVSCDREDMEDHMKICRLQDVQCDFSDLGCDDRLCRENLEKHSRQNVHKHLVLIGNDNKSMKVKLQEQEKELQMKDARIKEQDIALAELRTIVKDQEVTFKEYQEEMQLALAKQQKMTNDLHIKFQNMETFLDKSNELEKMFSIRKFSKRRDMWRSPQVYSRIGGIKFHIEVALESGIFKLSLVIDKGEFDQFLQWPLLVTLTVEILEQRSGDNLTRNFFDRVQRGLKYRVISIRHHSIEDYIHNDTMYFIISKLNH